MVQCLNLETEPLKINGGKVIGSFTCLEDDELIDEEPGTDLGQAVYSSQEMNINHPDAVVPEIPDHLLDICNNLTTQEYDKQQKTLIAKLLYDFEDVFSKGDHNMVIPRW